MITEPSPFLHSTGTLQPDIAQFNQFQGAHRYFENRKEFCFDFLNQLPNGPVMSVYIGVRYVLITQIKTAGYTFHCALNHRGFCYVRDFECANWSHFPISFPGSSCPRPYCMVVVHPTTIVYIFTNKLSQLRHSGKRSDFPCSMSRR